MHRFAVASLLLVFLVAGPARTDEKKPSIKWMVSKFEEGMKAAKEAKKPVFVDFTMEG